MRRYVYGFITCCILLLSNSIGFTATYWLATSEDNGSDTNPGSESLPWATFEHAFSNMTGGDTLIVKDGTYNDRIVDPPSGNPVNYTTIKADEDGGVKLISSQADVIYISGSYIKIEGIDVVTTSPGGDIINIEGGSHIKLLRCSAFRKGGISSYPSGIGINSDYVLVEDCAFGGGARYIIGIGGYHGNANKIIIRRCVLRWDYDCIDSPPARAACMVYGNKAGDGLVSDIVFQNVIVLDNNDASAFSTDGYYRNLTVCGCIALNIKGGIGLGGSMGEGERRNYYQCVLWDIEGYGIGVWGLVANVDQTTMGKTNGIYSYNGGSITNSLFVSNTGDIDSHPTYSNNIFHNNTFSPLGDNFIEENPNLRYILKATDTGRGLSGKKIGATIEYRYGRRETLWGEDGWDELTTDNLWPWPYESRWKTVLCQENPAPDRAFPSQNDWDRGFCQAESLTGYIWEYLGNPCPSDICGSGDTEGHVYYVSPNGDDSDNGLSSESAWRTIQHAADSVSPGDTVIVEEGSYSGFYITKDGSEDLRIIFRANGDVIIEGGVDYDGRNASIHVLGDYITIDGFKCRPEDGSHDRGIRVSGVASDFVQGVIIKNCEIRDAGWCGITSSYAEDIIIENNIISGSMRQHGIYVANSADRPIIRGNTCYGNYEAGIQLNADMKLPGDHIISGAIIEKNIIYNNGQGGSAAVNLASVRNSVIRNNLIYNNHSGGIANWDDGYSDWGDPGNYTYGCKNNIYVNNTVIMPSNSRHGLSFRNGSTGNVVKNNILIQLGDTDSIAVDHESLSGLDSDYNIVTRFENSDGDIVDIGQWRSIYNLDIHSFVADAGSIFNDFSGGDYSLKEDSVAIDAGIEIESVEDDIAGNARPQGSGWDIGAYECVASSYADEDVNRDGQVNISDVQLVINVILDNATNSCADVNGDGNTNVNDVQTVVNKIIG